MAGQGRLKPKAGTRPLRKLLLFGAPELLSLQRPPTPSLPLSLSLHRPHWPVGRPQSARRLSGWGCRPAGAQGCRDITRQSPCRPTALLFLQQWTAGCTDHWNNTNTCQQSSAPAESQAWGPRCRAAARSAVSTGPHKQRSQPQGAKYRISAACTLAQPKKGKKGKKKKKKKTPKPCPIVTPARF